MKLKRNRIAVVLLAGSLLMFFCSSTAAAALPTEPELIATLTSPDAPKADKAIACKQLAVVGSGAGVAAVVPLLSDPELTSWARITLEAIDAPESQAALLEAVTTLDGLPQIGVIHSLGVKASADSTETLAKLLEEGSPEVASAAALSLSKIGGEPAITALRKAMTNSAGGIRSATAEAIVRCAETLMNAGDASGAQSLYDEVLAADVPLPRKVEATRGAILSRGVDGIDLLIESLGSDNVRLQGIALMAARQLSGEGAIDQLVAASSRVPADLQSLYLIALGDRGEADLVPTLIETLATAPKEFADVQSQLAALKVLESLGDADGLPTLLTVAMSSTPELADAATRTLAKIDDTELDSAIVNQIKSADGRTRMVLLKLIGERRIDAIDTLLAAADATDAETRHAALNAMGNVASLDQLPILIERATASDSGDAKVALKSLQTACLRMPDRASCVAKLTEAMRQSNQPTQLVLLETLAAMGGPEALEVLGEVAQGDDFALQDAATRLLGGWMTVDAGPVLIAIAEQPNHAFRIRAVRAYLRLVRQFVMKPNERHEMTAAALKIADRDPEKLLILDAAKRYPSGAMLKTAIELSQQPTLKTEAQKAALEIARSVKASPQLTKMLDQLELGQLEIKIVKATYGSKDQRVDVTDAVQAKTNNSPLIGLPSGGLTAALGVADPAPNVPKTLRIEFQVNGKDTTVEFPETATLILPVR